MSGINSNRLKVVQSKFTPPQEEMQNSDPTRYHAAWHSLCSAKGVIVPGGFGHRGTEGKMMAIKWCREKKVRAHKPADFMRMAAIQLTVS